MRPSNVKCKRIRRSVTTGAAVIILYLRKTSSRAASETNRHFIGDTFPVALLVIQHRLLVSLLEIKQLASLQHKTTKPAFGAKCSSCLNQTFDEMLQRIIYYVDRLTEDGKIVKVLLVTLQKKKT